MITNNGKEIIAKFLLRQAPEFATHIAAGCGKMPLYPNQELTEEAVNSLKTKRALDFEIFRVPITAKGFIKEGGVEKIVFKAEMPTEQRFLISEIGFYPSESNVVAGAFDSRNLFAFVPTENWTLISPEGSSIVPNLTEPQNIFDQSTGDIIAIDPAYFLPSGLSVFNLPERRARQEGPRFYSNSLSLSGSSSYINSNYEVSTGGYRIENPSVSFNFSQNLPTDQVKLAINLVSKNLNRVDPPDGVRIIVEFVNDLPGQDLSAPKSRMEISLGASDFSEQDTGQVIDPQNRYKVITKTISQLKTDDAFSFTNINLIRVYACAFNIEDEEEVVTGDFNILLDGLRIENISAQNPLYALVGYDIIRNDSAFPILKADNTNNFIEYRFGIGVDG
jgi:hypothetical protein